MAQIINLSFPAVPNFPNGGMAYEQRYQNELNNILRLYLERLTAQLQALSGDDGGFYLSFPHISARSESDQIADGDNTPTLITWDTLISGLGFTLNPSGSATAGYSGVYTIQYSVQIANTDNTSHDFYMWLRVNGVDVTETARSFTLIPRKSVGNYSFLAGYSSISFEINAGDDIELYWATDQRYESGVSDGIFLEAQPAITSPYARPSIPSASGSITFVSGV
jgi:hypothetical protein